MIVLLIALVMLTSGRVGWDLRDYRAEREEAARQVARDAEWDRRYGLRCAESNCDGPAVDDDWYCQPHMDWDSALADGDGYSAPGGTE